jgi:hypothetical protein
MAKLTGSVINTNRLSLDQEMRLAHLERQGNTLSLWANSAGYGIEIHMDQAEAEELKIALGTMLQERRIASYHFDPPPEKP